MLEIVTVAYDPELAILLLQARSIRIFSKCGILYTIYWNSKNKDFIRNNIVPALEKELSGCNIYWRVIHVEEILPANLIGNAPGRRSQQVIKLLASTRVMDSFYLVLDAKNHFIASFCRESFFDNGKPISHRQNYSNSGFKEFIDVSASIMGVDALSHDQALPTTTPYLMIRDDVSEMLRMVEEKFGNRFESLFLHDERFIHTSEFILYYSFIIKKYTEISSAYSIKDPLCVTFFRIGPSKPDAIEKSIAKIEAREVICMGLHERRVASIDPLLGRRFARVWRETGLMADDAEVLKFFPNLQIQAEGL